MIAGIGATGHVVLGLVVLVGGLMATAKWEESMRGHGWRRFARKKVLRARRRRNGKAQRMRDVEARHEALIALGREASRQRRERLASKPKD